MKFFTTNQKTGVWLFSLLLAVLFIGNILFASPALAEIDPLSSWKDTGRKEEIISFVEKVTNDRDRTHFVSEEDRIAVFDNDGTLWAERPQYFQLDFLEANRKAQPQVNLKKLLKTTRKEVDPDGDDISEIDDIITVLQELAVFDGISTEEYIETAADFVNTTDHNSLDYGDSQTYLRFDAKLKDLTYEPVIQLVDYLKANGFKVYICSGGGVDFVRSFAEPAYGIPPQEVIGSAIKTKFDKEFGGKVVRQAFLGQYNDKFGKPVGIERHIGKRPIIAVGNSGGDYEMFQYTDVDVDKSLVVLINHDDCEREYEYNNFAGEVIEEGKHQGDPKNKSLDEAQNRDNWLVVSMKEDFKNIFETEPPVRENLSCS